MKTAWNQACADWGLACASRDEGAQHSAIGQLYHYQETKQTTTNLREWFQYKNMPIHKGWATTEGGAKDDKS